MTSSLGSGAGGGVNGGTLALVLVAVAVVAAVALAFVLGGCGRGADRNIVYEDMETAFDQAGLRSANIGLFTRTEQDGNITYENGGSGVIFARDGNLYYALTSAHVVSAAGAQFLVYTVNTDMRMEEIPGFDLNVLAQEAYDAMYVAEVLFASGRDDLAVIRFACEEELAVAPIAESDPGVGDRILCVGNPGNEWFSVTYGKVTSGMKRLGETTGFPSTVMEHSAYMNTGSSGGAAFGEGMELVGITPGVVMSLDRRSVERGVLIPASEIRLCLAEWGGQW